MTVWFMRRRAAAGLLTVLCAAAHSASRAMTVEEAVELALAGNPTIEASRAMAAAARARTGAAKAMTGLQVSVTGHASTGSMPMILSGPEAVMPRSLAMAPDKGQVDGVVMAMYPLHTGGLLGGMLEGARSGQQASDAELAAVELDIALAAKTAFYRVLLARRFIDAYQARVDEAQERVRIAEAAYAEGRIAKFDLLRNHTDLAEARQLVNNARAEAEVALADLKNVLGVAQGTSVDLSGDLTMEPAAGDIGEMHAAAQRDRPEVRAARARLAAARSGVSAAAGALKPQVYATAMAEAMTARNDSDSGYMVGVSAALPLFDGGLRRSAVEEARAMVKEAESREREVALEVSRDVTAAYSKLRAAEANVGLAAAAVEQADEDYRVIRLRYEAGKSANVEVLDALASLTRARTGIASALYEHNTARARLARAVGQK